MAAVATSSFFLFKISEIKMLMLTKQCRGINFWDWKFFLNLYHLYIFYLYSDYLSLVRPSKQNIHKAIHVFKFNFSAQRKYDLFFDTTRKASKCFQCCKEEAELILWFISFKRWSRERNWRNQFDKVRLLPLSNPPLFTLASSQVYRYRWMVMKVTVSYVAHSRDGWIQMRD